MRWEVSIEIYASCVLHNAGRISHPSPVLRGWRAASGPEGAVSELLELHDSHDPALRQCQRAAGELLERDAGILHRVPAIAEAHALTLELFQHLLERRIDPALHERLERRAEYDKLAGTDVLPPANPGHMISDIPEDKLRLINARLIELVEDPVSLRVLLEVHCIYRCQPQQHDGHRENRPRKPPMSTSVHSASPSSQRLC